LVRLRLLEEVRVLRLQEGVVSLRLGKVRCSLKGHQTLLLQGRGLGFKLDLQLVCLSFQILDLAIEVPILCIFNLLDLFVPRKDLESEGLIPLLFHVQIPGKLRYLRLEVLEVSDALLLALSLTLDRRALRLGPGYLKLCAIMKRKALGGLIGRGSDLLQSFNLLLQLSILCLYGSEQTTVRFGISLRPLL